MPVITASPAAEPTSLSDALARWRAIVEAELKGAPFEKKLVTPTFEGLALQPLYTRADIAVLSEGDSRPGAAPFRRGVRTRGYADRPWEVAQSIAAAAPADFNAALLAALNGGQNAVVLSPDAATLRACDPDTAEAGEVGRRGVSLADAQDMSAALDKVDLTAVPVHITGTADAAPLAALLLETARGRGIGWGALSGSLTADPLTSLAMEGTLPAEIEDLYASLAGWTGWAERYAPELRTIGVNAAAWGNAGATATQELAVALATASEYLRELLKRDLSAKVAVQRIAFNFSIGPRFFSEIAKFRAFRPLWTRVVAAFALDPALAAAATLKAETAKWNKTLLDPHVNLLRVTIEALSAVLGGCDGLHVAPFDEVSGATGDFSRRIARNVHALLAEEFGFAVTADPAGGSWYVEKLTEETARSAWKMFQDIEREGGMLAALKSGYIQRLVGRAAAEKRDAVDKRRLGLVGTNLFPNLKEKPLAEANDADRGLATQRGKEIAARRTKVFAAATTGASWEARFHELLLAARAGATIGQLGAMTSGTRKPTDRVERMASERVAVGFELLRAATAEHARRNGCRPRVFLAKMGPPLQHKARADFSAGFFSVGGFEVLAKENFETAEGAARAALKSGARIAVLCSTDESYAELVPAFGRALKGLAPEMLIVLAGLPAEAATVARYREFGVDEFIHLRANVRDVLASLLKQIGVIA